MSSDTNPSRNTYLDQVVEQQAQLEQNLRAKRHVPSMQMAPGAARRARPQAPDEAPAGAAVEVRITGWWWWKTVVVPPNAYVVHTRRGKSEPITIGLGVSFRYDPTTDAYLVVPGAMQTILITARSICRERQGVLVQGYVQWIIQDFATAYRKLDFSDAEDPMRLVTLQLKEQAEAAIKDKVSTMSIDAVLSDKQPIIEELTARLRDVAEGAGGSDTGLGLRIVTVQIKEAVVSSPKLWESLQKPFRAEREQVARLAELEAQEVIAHRELDQGRRRESARLSTERELAKLEQESARALAIEQQTTHLEAVELSRARHAADVELARLQADAARAQEKAALEARLGLEAAEALARFKRRELDAAGLTLEQAVENGLSPAGLRARALAALPALVEKLPQPKELKAVTIGATPDPLVAAVAQLKTLLSVLGSD
jgi:hypothetical protein